MKTIDREVIKEVPVERIVWRDREVPVERIVTKEVPVAVDRIIERFTEIPVHLKNVPRMPFPQMPCNVFCFHETFSCVDNRTGH